MKSLITRVLARTPRTITTRETLLAHLADIRRQGYAYDDEENEIGVRCLAAPVYDITGMLVATIGISGPTVRVTPERISGLAEAVMRAGCELSLELGFQNGLRGAANDLVPPPAVELLGPTIPEADRARLDLPEHDRVVREVEQRGLFGEYRRLALHATPLTPQEPCENDDSDLDESQSRPQELGRRKRDGG